MIVIYHKTTCSTSRKVLQMIREAGFDPQVIDYVATGWTRAQLLGLFAAADVTPAQALRVKGTDAAERGLPEADDATVLAAMAAEPALIERPLVETDKGVRLCRPMDKVHEIL